MRYENQAYLWPPRPDQAIPPTLLSYYENRGYVAQIKKNGTCSVIFVSPDKKVTAMSRHNDQHKAWQPTPAVMKRFADLPGKGWYVFVAELLHNKVPGIKNVNYIHDILVRDGEYLVGSTQAERQQILRDLFVKGDEERTYSHFILDEHTWLTIQYKAGFKKLFERLTADEDEGVVLKDPNAKLQICSRQNSNNGGMVKCRKPHKNFSW